MAFIYKDLAHTRCDCMQPHCNYCGRKLDSDYEFITFQSKSSWNREVEMIRIMEKSGKAFARVYWYLDDSNSIYLDSLSVSEVYRRKGLGTKLQEMREDIGRLRSAKYSYLWVEKGSWMEEWYKRRGYSYYKEYEDLNNHVWMRKELNQ